MPQMRPALVYADPAQWGVNYLTSRLSGRSEPFAQDVDVRGSAPDESTDDPWPESTRLVTVREDGGSRQLFSKSVRLAVNVWSGNRPQDAGDCADLAELVAALLDDSPGHGSVVAVTASNGPFPVPEKSGRPHRYLTVELVFTGSALSA